MQLDSRNVGLQGFTKPGSLSSAWPGSNQTSFLFLIPFPSSLTRCPPLGQERIQPPAQGCSNTVSNRRKKTRHLLGLPSVEINKVLDLQTCWYGDLNDTTKG